MPHFRLVSDTTMIDYSAPVAFATFACSLSVDQVVEHHRPAGHKFTANAKHNKFWFNKFCAHTTTYPDFVEFAKNKRGRWFARANYL